MQLSGTVFKGRGEGAHYVEIYEEEIKKLGIDPFYGTLNLRVEKAQRNQFISQLKPTKISGFSREGVRYGGLYCYKAKDKDGQALLLVVPERTHHSDDVLEIISTKNLRDVYNLHYGDTFSIHAN